MRGESAVVDPEKLGLFHFLYIYIYIYIFHSSEIEPSASMSMLNIRRSVLQSAVTPRAQLTYM